MICGVVLPYLCNIINKYNELIIHSYLIKTAKMRKLLFYVLLLVSTSLYSQEPDTIGATAIQMFIEEKSFSAGEEFTLDVWSDQLDGIVAWQFRLNFENAQILEINEGSPFDNIPHNIFNQSQTMNSLWTPADTQPVDVSSNETWFTLTIVSDVDGKTNDIFTTENDPWSEIVLEDGDNISGVAADFSFQIEERGFLVSSEEIYLSDIRLQNNPVLDRLVVSGLGSNGSVSQLRIYRMDGSPIVSQTIDNVDQVDLDVTSLASGIYILYLNGANSESIKFIKI
jgi:hypothetical protein